MISIIFISVRYQMIIELIQVSYYIIIKIGLDVDDSTEAKELLPFPHKPVNFQIPSVLKLI